MKTKTTTRCMALAAATVAALATMTGPNAAAGTELEVVASGLHNPRGITVAPNGDIYVAEAGLGGSGECFTNPEGGGDVCFGASGAITRVAGGSQMQVVTGLPSVAVADGSGATGPSDVVTMGVNRLAIAVGLGMDPAQRDAAGPELAQMGTVVEVLQSTGKQADVADVAAFEGSVNPVDDPDSNPTSLVRWGATYVVVDAGGNTVVRAKRLAGGVSAMAVIPGGMTPAPPFLGLPPGTEIPYQAVPTAVTRGPDGAFYVSQLTGFPFPVGGANIYRVGTDGTLSVYAEVFTGVTDLAFGADGALYAVEFSTGGLLSQDPGALIRITPDGQQTMVAGDLFLPYGLAIDDGVAYVTTGSATPAGQVVAIPL